MMRSGLSFEAGDGLAAHDGLVGAVLLDDEGCNRYRHLPMAIDSIEK